MDTSTEKNQGSQLKPAEYHEERKHTDLPAEGGSTRDKIVIKNITAPRPTYNQVTLGLRGEEEEKSTVTQPPKAYFSKAVPTGATYAQCLGQARAPLGATRGARLLARKKDYTKHPNSGPTPAEAPAQGVRTEDRRGQERRRTHPGCYEA